MTITDNSYGIDYGHGKVNIDTDNGIRFGVLHQNDVLQAWADEAESVWPEPSCPACGGDVAEYDEDTHAKWALDIEARPGDYAPVWTHACEACESLWDEDDMLTHEPIGHSYRADGYNAAQSQDDGDIFIVKSEFYTHAQFCSPCAPGACHLGTPTDEGGARAYCFAPDWFGYDGGEEQTGIYDGQATSCQYPVYQVSDGACVFTPSA
jgi:hypothetical protein